MENIKKNNEFPKKVVTMVDYKRFNPKEARRNVEEKFLAIEKIKTNRNKKLPNVEYAIEMIKISKSFNNGKIIANDEIDLLVAKNEIHAIIGENGAGKSTLMSILFGIYEPDEGMIKINNKTVKLLSANDAAKYKLGMVHQHFKLIPTYTVLQNIMLGSEDVIPWTGILNENVAKNKLNKIIRKYNLRINLKDKIENLNVSQEQRVEILKLLYKNLDILIFDEPTAVLTPFEIEQFLEILKTLKNEGKTIIIITHKFAEIKSVADRVTVIRHGRFISAFNIADKTIQEMAEEMVGRKIDEIKNTNHKYGDKVILDVKRLNLSKEIGKNNVNNKLINFSIKEGQIFAVAGVSGNGQTELALVLAGFKKANNAQIKLLRVDISNFSINERYKAGLSHIPEDRQKHGLILDMSCSINSVSNKIDGKEFSTFGFLKNYQIGEHARNLFKKYDVRGTTSGTTLARSLSGGNQQKLIIARELDSDGEKDKLTFSKETMSIHKELNRHKIILTKKITNFNKELINMHEKSTKTQKLIIARELNSYGEKDKSIIEREINGIHKELNRHKIILTKEITNMNKELNEELIDMYNELINMHKKHKLIIMVQPTRGLDLGAIEYVHARILDEKRKGNAILLISYELSEIFALADTVAVINNGVFVDVSEIENTSRQKIGELMLAKENFSSKSSILDDAQITGKV